jgi:hypothetical protein
MAATRNTDVFQAFGRISKNHVIEFIIPLHIHNIVTITGCFRVEWLSVKPFGLNQSYQSHLNDTDNIIIKAILS